METSRAYSEFEIEGRLRSFARLITRNFQLKVIFEGERAYLTPERMQIPPVENSPKAMSRAKFYVSHECGHALHSDFSVMVQAKREDKRLGDILNSLEDARIEKLMISNFPGLEKDMDKNIREIIDDWDVSKMPLAMQLIYGLYLLGRNYDVGFFSQDAQSLLYELTPEIKSSSEAKDCNGVLEQSRLILEKIDKIIEEPPKIQITDSSTDKAGKAVMTDKQKTTDSEEPPVISEEAKKELKENDFSGPSISKLIKDHFDEVKREEDYEEGEDYEEYKDENNKEDRTIVRAYDGDLSEYLRVFEPLRSEYNYLRRELRKIVAQKRVKKRRISYVGGQKQGIIDTKRLYKIATDEDKIFKRRGEADIKTVDPDNLVIYLLCDESYSMNTGDRYIAAKKAVIVLGETLDSLSIPFALTGYSTDYQGLKRFCYKRFEDDYKLRRCNLNSITYHRGTFTAEHLPFAQRRLEIRKERKKLLIVITDSEDIESEYRLKKALDSLKNAGIEVIGIGIHTNLMADYYDRFIEIEHLQGFGGKLLNLLKTVLME